MAIIDQYEDKFIKTPSFTDETTVLVINDTRYLGEPGYVNEPERLWLGMSLYGPDNFDELTMGLPFVEIDLALWGTRVEWNILEHQVTIRKMLSNLTNSDVYVYAKGLENGIEYIHWHKCNITLLNTGALPIYTVEPNYVVNDSLTKTLAGNSNTIICYVTDVTINFTAEAQKNGAIYGYSIKNGSQTDYEAVLYNPSSVNGSITFTNSDSPTFEVTVEDSRGYSSTSSIEVPNFIEYFFPTCRIKAQTPSATGGATKITAEGIAFNGSFGSKSNTISLQCRYKTSGGSWSSWYTMTATRSGTGYNASTNITGLDYQSTYIFEGRIIDAITTVTSSQVYARAIPIFDWGEEDFNFNVPVNINNTTLNMNDETILRHTGASTNNTVLSASGGHIYIRPGGTSDTTGEIKISPQGNIEIKGNLTIPDGCDLIINGYSLLDALETLDRMSII